MCDDHNNNQKKQNQIDPLKIQGGDNPADDIVKDKSEPNQSLKAEEIIEANNFLGDL